MVIKVERGNPTPEELAAVVALVQARAAAAAGPADGPRAADEWASPARNVPGRMLRPAPVSWRSSYWPH
ncbi:acyl-CoA carboxylase subunit epsilon [Streptomyces sp. NPDC058864]